MNKYFAVKGNAIKSIDLAQYPDEAWDFLTNSPEVADDNLYGRVAPVFRAINLFANVCSALPFALVNIKSGQDVDISTDWKNTVGFFPRPIDMLRRWYMSLSMTNTGYGFMEGDRIKKTNIAYIVPQTITPKVESGTAAMNYVDGGLRGFTRTVGTQRTYYPLESGRIVYLWRRDHTTEIMPSKNTEFRAMASAAGILRFADIYTENYLSSGGVKPAIIGIKGSVAPDVKDKTESSWDKFIRGISRLRAKVVNADVVTVTPFGDGISDTKDSNVFEEQCKKIAMAKGMPLSMLLSDYDNYSTAQVYATSWFNNDILPYCDWFAAELSAQIFEPLGLRMEYRPEKTDAGTEDEVQRAQAYAAYVGTNMLPSIAAQLCGIEMPNGMDYTALDPAPAPTPAAVTTETPAPVYETTPEPAPAKFIPSVEQLREMELWQTFAFRALKKKRSLVSLKFETKTIPPEVADVIRVRLGFANTEAEIKAAFGLDNIEAAPVTETVLLARITDKLVEAVKTKLSLDSAREKLAAPKANPDAILNALELAVRALEK